MTVEKIERLCRFLDTYKRFFSLGGILGLIGVLGWMSTHRIGIRNYAMAASFQSNHGVFDKLACSYELDQLGWRNTRFGRATDEREIRAICAAVEKDLNASAKISGTIVFPSAGSVSGLKLCPDVHVIIRVRCVTGGLGRADEERYVRLAAEKFAVAPANILLIQDPVGSPGKTPVFDDIAEIPSDVEGIFGEGGQEGGV